MEVSSMSEDIGTGYDDGGPAEREIEAVISQLERLDARVVAIGHGRDPRSIRAARRFAAAWQAGRDWEGVDREVAVTVDWPAEAASWLKAARRFGDSAVDAWVVADTPPGWTRMSARLLASTAWSPRRTVAFAGLDSRPAGALVETGRLDGLTGAGPDGGLWFFDGGNLIRHKPTMPRR
jgi:hypothetical protein